MSYAPFEVLLVPFPYADKLSEKVRPAVVVSRAEMQDAAGVIWLSMVTSAKRQTIPGDIEITDLEVAGLQLSCAIRTSKLTMIDPARVLRRLGALAATDARATSEQLLSWLAIPQA